MTLENIYAKEFDENVNQYNEWLKSMENPSFIRKTKLHSFFKGMSSIFDIYGGQSIKETSYDNPLYSNENLTQNQKDAIALGSDWQRINLSLDQIISGELESEGISIKDAIQSKELVQQMYGEFRDIYVTDAIRKKETYEKLTKICFN